MFQPSTIDIPTIKYLENSVWKNCPKCIQPLVCREYQYFIFQIAALSRIHFTSAGSVPNHTWSKPIGFTTRAGAIKAALLVAASIIEAVLRAIAEERNYRLPENKRKRTFGKVLGAWKLDETKPRPEIEEIWEILGELHDVRNNVHLFSAITECHTYHSSVLRQERKLLESAQIALDHISLIIP